MLLRRIHKPLNPKTAVEAAGVDLLQDGDATRGKWLEKRRKRFLHGFLLNGFVFLAGLQRQKADSCWRSKGRSQWSTFEYGCQKREVV